MSLFFPENILVGIGVLIGVHLCRVGTTFLRLGELGCQNTAANSLVNKGGSSLLGEHQPNQESNFERKVQWNPVQDDVGEVLQDAEESKDDPVSQPLRIIVLALGLECLDTGVGRVDETNQVAEKSRAKDEVHDKN